MEMTKVEELAMRVLADNAGAFTTALGYIGDKLGLFRKLAEMKRATSEELAAACGLNERYVREWLAGMVASEYFDYDPDTKQYLMNEEQAFVHATENGPASLGGAFQFTAPSILHLPRIVEAFQHGGGIPYGEIGCEVHRAIERIFAPGYEHFLVKEWLASVPGLVQRLADGARVLDVGCGRGQSTIQMAKAFPNSRFDAVDSHAGSIEAAWALGSSAGVTNARFLNTAAETLPSDWTSYDLICTFDCIHDMIDPKGALKALRRALAGDGVHLWAEPSGSDNPMENRTAFAKLHQVLSPFHCMTVSLAHGGAALGTVIGEKGARELAAAAGYASFERLPVNDPQNQFYLLRQ